MSCRPSIVAAVLATLPVVGCVLQDWSSYAGGETSTKATEAGDAGTEAAGAEAGPGLDLYALEVGKDAPVAWYRFEDADTATEAMSTSGAYPAALPPGAVLRVPGSVGHGVQLDGQGGLDLGDVFDFAGQVPFTLEAWVRSTPQGHDQLLFDKRESLSDGGLLGYIGYLGSDLSPQFQGWGVDLSCWAQGPFAADRFAHVVIVVSYATGKGNASLYVDGQLSPNGGFDNVRNLADTQKHLVVGGSVTGILDEVAIYDTALPAARILAHYHAGTP